MASHVSEPPVRIGDVDLERAEVAAENRRLAQNDEEEAAYHATMAASLAAVGDTEASRTARIRATLLRRTAQIKRDLAQKYNPRRRDS